MDCSTLKESRLFLPSASTLRSMLILNPYRTSVDYSKSMSIYVLLRGTRKPCESSEQQSLCVTQWMLRPGLSTKIILTLCSYFSFSSQLNNFVYCDNVGKFFFNFCLAAPHLHISFKLKVKRFPLYKVRYKDSWQTVMRQRALSASEVPPTRRR